MKYIFLIIGSLALLGFYYTRSILNTRKAIAQLNAWTWVNLLNTGGSPLFSGKIVGRVDQQTILLLGYIHKKNVNKQFIEVLESKHGQLPDLILAKCISGYEEEVIINELQDQDMIQAISQTTTTQQNDFECILVDSGGITHIDNEESITQFNKLWAQGTEEQTPK